MFLLVTLQGEVLQNASWTPEDKLGIQFGNWAKRAYTPISWDAAAGVTRLLIYLKAGGPGTQWARALEAGASCKLQGPRGSIELTRVRGPALCLHGMVRLKWCVTY